MLYAPWSRTSCFFEAPPFIHGQLLPPHGGRNDFRLRTARLFIAAVLLTIALLHVAFSSYGAFWLSFATLFIPNSGIADAYKTAPKNMEDDAIGIFLIAWMIVTFLFL